MAFDAEQDIGDGHIDEHEQHVEDEEEIERPRALPTDLPRSLDDRKNFRSYNEEAEYYDAWQGQSQTYSAPTTAKPLSFNLALHEPDDDSFGRDFGNDEARVAQMFASQSRRGTETDAGEVEEDDVLQDEQMSPDQKAKTLQDFLFMAASNGDAKRVERLVRGQASDLVDIDAVDAEGTPPLVYASCFGHKDAVLALLNAGATVDNQDRNQWTALMWAMTNRHRDIAKILLDHGASTDVKSSSGRTALDFVPPNSDISDLLQHRGYSIGNAGMANDDFYNAGLAQDRFEEELAENEMRRRMLMESAINLEVDLGNLELDDRAESADEMDEGQEFVWDRCLSDQMFVFMENDIENYLDIVITRMAPLRSPTQKPTPANVIFLGARYAHYHANNELLQEWLLCASEKIEAVVESSQWDMAVLAFWISNATLLIYYLRKDPGLARETIEFQARLTELIQEIYILIIRDAERRMDKVIMTAMLEHETIPGFEDTKFQNEWKFLRTRTKVQPEPQGDKRFRPPSPKRKAQISPRNITSLLSSTLFVLDLYDVHPVITAQILSQLYYWLSAEIFNRIMSNKRYLARTKAMQIRMNVSMLEDWARTNNRQPELDKHGAVPTTQEATVDAARRHLAPVVQLLQWLQCFSGFGEDRQAMEETIDQMPILTTSQLLHAVKHYRAEVGEPVLSKTSIKMIQEIKSRPRVTPAATTAGVSQGKDTSPPNGTDRKNRPLPPTPQQLQADEDDAPTSNLLNPAILLPFHLPTSTDMLISYGAGFGGVNKERERRYIPAVPAEFLAKLDPDGSAYVKQNMAVKRIPAEQIDATFKSDSIDLINKALGSRILSVSDEWFAAAENLTTPTSPICKPGVFTYAGAWYDGWETRRHNPEPFDWVVIRLGVASGKVRGVEIDTAFFNGNQAPEIAVQGCFVDADNQLEKELQNKDFKGWETILDKQECGPSQRHGWLLPAVTEKAYTHVRLQMFPDGGIARFRLYGHAVPVFPQDINAVFDLAATVNGGVAVKCSDQHFGTKDNLLLPGRGVDMGDGWETKRSRGEHIDWSIIRLGASGYIDKLVVDTAHFRGNFPQKVQVFAAPVAEKAPEHEDNVWVEVLPPQKTGPDAEHEYGSGVLKKVEGKVYGFAKLVIIPDGGVKRIRVFGRRRAESALLKAAG
ncbi:hypothetical protein EJ03DRAFT_310696 [Teratosphaeria nubilosa]|uniref:allantoicase n=1 Tax=Teratosphaeria nubilosa TaxID=161662 RepID=A0A6G1LCP7_9PEZI|nr:hypothetical protein EJ03DRAFT_310696 [Teratosphaeria nubilosa]